jgi:hypothetical protein
MAEENEQLTRNILNALKRCINLRICVWTRDGSLSAPIIDSLASCPRVEDITINGRTEGHYLPQSILKFSNLKRLTIIMPSAAIVSLLPIYFLGLGTTLTHFSLICKVCLLHESYEGHADNQCKRIHHF